MNEQFLSEIRKGLKTFRVFEELEKYADEISSIEQSLSEKRNQIKILNNQIEISMKNKEDIDAEVIQNKNLGNEIVALSKLEAKKIKEVSENKSKEIINKAEKKAAEVEKQIDEKTICLDIIKSSIKKESASLDEIRLEIEEYKKRFKNLIES